MVRVQWVQMQASGELGEEEFHLLSFEVCVVAVSLRCKVEHLMRGFCNKLETRRMKRRERRRGDKKK